MAGRFLFIFLFFCSYRICTQELQFSRIFPSVSKNYPTRIFQSAQGHFYVLRYNRKAHDLTIERRSAVSAEIVYFTPLRLDSINSKVFNYANLDYILFEYGNSLYFVFEREFNNSKAVFFKCIDSLGKSGPFVEILSLSRQLQWVDFELGFTVTNKACVILETAIHYSNQSVKKSLSCYDLVNNTLLWNKALPLENAVTGNSKAFVFDNNAIYYIQVRSELTGYKRKYDKHRQLLIPEIFHDSLYLVKFSLTEAEYLRKPFLSGIHRLHSLRLQIDNGNLLVYSQISRTLSEQNDPQLQFYSASFELGNLEQVNKQLTPLGEQSTMRLTYYDGTDSKLAADKDFTFLKEFSISNSYFQIVERKEGGIYKELMLWEINKQNGTSLNQYLLPRRMLSSETWSKFPDIGEALCVVGEAQLQVYLAEPSDNRNLDPNTSIYYQMKKKSSLRHCELIQYKFLPNNSIEKKILYRNADFEFIPVRFESSEKGAMIFYFTNGKQEKFAWIKA